MAKQVQFRRGTTSQHSTFTGAAGEITVDTDKDTAVVHDGSTAGGAPLAKASELANKVENLSDLGITATATELNYVDGVTSDIQTQLDAKGTVSTLSDLSVTASSTELNYVDGVTSAIQTQLNAKLDKSGGTMTGNLILNADPTTALGAATKEYVDTIAAAGIHYHDPVRVEQEGNLTATYDNGTAGVGATLTNSGTQAALVIDGVTLNSADRVLVYEQTDQTQNGIYTVTNTGSASTNWVLTRATDADSYGASDPDALGQGDAFFVQEGTAGSGELYVMNTEGTITFGTTGITFTQIQSTAIYTAGTDLTLDGTTFNLNSTIAADTTGNAATATAWATGRTVSLTGDVTGTATGVDGSGNVSITTTVTSPYADSDVDTHLNTSTAATGEFLSWNGTDYDWAAASATLSDLGVTASAADLNRTDVTTLGTVEASKVVTADNSGNFIVPDGSKVYFGDGLDLQIHHNGSKSNIWEVGSGGLEIATNGSEIVMYDGQNARTMAKFVTGTGVKLYNGQGTEVFNTSSSGVLAAGKFEVDGETRVDEVSEHTQTASAITGNVNFDILNGAVLLHTSNALSNFAVNLRGDASTTYDSISTINRSHTIAHVIPQGSTGYYPPNFQIDGITIDPKWLGGSAPTAGNPNSIDVYTYTVFKTASAQYTILASLTQYA